MTHEGRKILVVENDQELQGEITEILQGASLDASVVSTAREAVNWMKVELPDVIIIDLNLEDVNGLELVRRMRARDAFNELPIIILLQDVDPLQIRDGLQAGADRYVTGIYLHTNLLDVTRDLLKNGRQKATE